MALAIGVRLGAYEITGTVGAGGMGEVYRARDTNLKRDVAIKVLPALLARDAERLGRFQREAEVLASLNHANIAQIYGLERSDGTTALAIELVEGPTLAERIARGPIPVEESLTIAGQIGDALEAAHARGIVHRDLKPANIKLRPDGTVKVLDFGIAKALDTRVTTSGDAPALTTPAMTAAGIVLGTAAYMSPEQAKGKAVDERSDIWAFGCVLYEMLTGQPAFLGEDMTSTLARVLERDPNLNTLPSGVSPPVRRTLELCFEKDARSRLADMRDVKLMLSGALNVAAPARALWRRVVPVAALVIGALLVGAYVASLRQARAPPAAPAEAAARLPVTRFVITPPATAPLASDIGNDLGISPDGRRIAYVTRKPDSGEYDIYVRELDAVEATPIPDSALKDKAARLGNPFFSPDGKSIGFVGAGSPGIVRLSLENQPGIRVLERPGYYYGATWGDDDTIFSSNGGSVLRISAGGGESPEVLTSTQEPKAYATPELLPGGRALLVTALDNAGAIEGIAALDLETLVLKPLVADANTPKYVESGHIVFARGSTLMAVSFDAAELAVTGEPVALVQSVRRPTLGAPDFAVSRNGTLAYVPGNESTQRRSAINWVDRNGKVVGRAIEDLVYNPRNPRLSPDGRRLLLLTGPDSTSALWIYDLGGRPPIPLALAGNHSWGVWSPDGKRVAFIEMQGGSGGLFVALADGSALTPELLSSSVNPWPVVWSAADELLLMGPPAADQGQYDIVAMRAEPNSEMRRILSSENSEISPALSPDGRWLAYLSTRTSGLELWLQSYPDGVPIRISRNGAVEPVWSADGRELYYLQDDAMMAVAIETEPALSPGTPTRLFSGFVRASFFAPYTSYDVARDGRFLVIEPPVAADDEAPPSIVVVQNWIEELKERVRPNGK